MGRGQNKGYSALCGIEVKTCRNLLEINGRKLLFEVRVTEGEKVIGEGQHRRNIILNNYCSLPTAYCFLPTA
jgi:predicted thioesterase